MTGWHRGQPITSRSPTGEFSAGEIEALKATLNTIYGNVDRLEDELDARDAETSTPRRRPRAVRGSATR